MGSQNLLQIKRPPLATRVSLIRAKVFVAVSLIVSLLFWSFPVVYPTKILAVFFHELGHAVMTWCLGGQVVDLEISANQGGSTSFVGANAILVLNAGYLGSALIGSAILIVSTRTNLDKLVLFGLSCVLYWVSGNLMPEGFGAQFLKAFGIFGGVTSLVMPTIWSEAVLVHISTTTALYVIYDIFSDISKPAGYGVSDALLLWEMTGIPAVFWGALWFATSCWILHTSWLVAVSSGVSEVVNSAEKACEQAA